jgi:predicted amidohydrolase
MRLYKDLDELMQQAEYFIDAVSGYRSDFALFPEFFNAPLMSEYNHLSESEAIRKLAEYTRKIVQRFAELAISYNINIITGSMPEIVENNLYNVGYLCKRDGGVERFEKIHITPDESKVWGLQGGNSIRTFDTDCGKIGILICYDVEFPELSRILANEGIDILFVPFLTDPQNGYSRVWYCAQARALEKRVLCCHSRQRWKIFPKSTIWTFNMHNRWYLPPATSLFPTNGIKQKPLRIPK